MAVPCILRVVQDGQIPRLLQEKATRISSPQAVQRTRTKPFSVDWQILETMPCTIRLLKAHLPELPFYDF